MSDTALLASRAVREVVRTPEALLPTIFIPLFFLVVNTGQVSEIFTAEDTPFLAGQGYAAFQLPMSLLLAASMSGAALFLVEEIEGGYFDKLRTAPVSRVAVVFGRLWAEGAKSVLLTGLLVLVAVPFGVRVASGPAGFAVLLVLVALFAVTYAGYMQLIALGTRSAAATNAGGMVFFPLLFVTPSFVPREQLSPVMEAAASFNPVTYLMEAARSLVLDVAVRWDVVGRGFAVLAVAMALMVLLSVRAVNRYE